MKIYKQIPTEFTRTIEFKSLKSVEEIIEDVKKSGDNAVSKYCKQFGDSRIKDFRLNEDEIEQAFNEIEPEVLLAIKFSINNVRSFAQKQLECLTPMKIQSEYGELGHNLVPIQSAACYIPGGNYPLPSSAIMGVVSAKVAGVKRVVAISPKIKPAVIVAAKLSGADEIYDVGGVQGIAALAYGTESIDKVDKIVGPGNKYVTSAKKYIYGDCGIDFLAGPSEVLIVADDNAEPSFVAADILAQCEHDVDARGYLLCLSEEFALRVQKCANEQLEKLETKDIAKIAYEKSIAIVVDSIGKAVKLSNLRAPEHLELMFSDADKIADKFINYGSLFIGSYCAEVFGDYVSGTNHVLPTCSVARYSGGLNVFDFIKVLTYQNITKQGAKRLGASAITLAQSEGLIAHANAVKQRLK